MGEVVVNILNNDTSKLFCKNVNDVLEQISLAATNKTFWKQQFIGFCDKYGTTLKKDDNLSDFFEPCDKDRFYFLIAIENDQNIHHVLRRTKSILSNPNHSSHIFKGRLETVI